MQNIVLSNRMEAVVNLVSPQSFVVADVGCDHAYVSIALVKRGLAQRVIAMDVKQGPLAIAKNNICGQGLDGKIELRLGDGIAKLLPGEADVIVIAGMGGLLIKRILENGKSVLKFEKKRPCLILQPQSDIDKVRIFLLQHAYHIVQEKMLLEDGKFYTIIKALPGAEQSVYDAVETVYGRWNLENRDSTLFQYLQKEWEVLCKIEGNIQEETRECEMCGPTEKRLAQIREQQRCNRLAMQYYEEDTDEMQ